MANKIVCGNHQCIYNDSTHCNLKSVALNGNGVCVLAKYIEDRKYIDNKIWLMEEE